MNPPTSEVDNHDDVRGHWSVRKSASNRLRSSDENMKSAWTSPPPTLPMTASSWTEDVGRRALATDEELHRLHETNLLLGEECSALKEVLNTKSLAANGECWRLREQVSTLFRENCSLKEHSAKVAIESKAVMKQLATIKKENAALRHRLAQFSQQLRSVTVTLDGRKSPSTEQSDVAVVGRVSPSPSVAGQHAEHGSLEQISNQLLQHNGFHLSCATFVPDGRNPKLRVRRHDVTLQLRKRQRDDVTGRSTGCMSQ